MGDAQRARRAAVDGQATAGLPMALNATSAVFFVGALVTAYRRRLWPMMFYAGSSNLLKLWFLDRMTFYYEEHREREEPPGEAEVAKPPPSA